ncbi:MAG: alkaline phosphatase family protein, partial [Bacteroidota bacterium]
LIDSPRDVDTYDQKPEMSAYKVTTALIEHIQKETPDFICVNYANTDMVGHTGDFEAAKAAAHAVDDCLGQLIQEARERDYETLIIADHGNSDIMITPSGEPHTAHTTNPVPIIYVGHQNLNLAPNGKLGDIAPTLLKLMQLDIPSEMTGSVLTS